MSWTQPQCSICWEKENPGREARVLINPDVETCCTCGNETGSGIYVRKDPTKVPYPQG